MKHPERNRKNEPITMTNMLTFIFNSLSFQYHFVIHFNNSRNYKTTAVPIGCFFTDQSSYTGSDKLRRNNVKGQNLFIHRSGRCTAHAVHLCNLHDPDSRDNNMCDKRILAITNLET